MFDESEVWAVIGWITCERYQKEHWRYDKDKYPWTAGYLDALEFVEERLRRAFKGGEPEGAVRLPDGSGCFVEEVESDD